MSVTKNFSFDYVLQSVILMGYSTEPKHGQLSKSKWVVSTRSQSNLADTHSLKCFLPKLRATLWELPSAAKVLTEPLDGCEYPAARAQNPCFGIRRS